jgi:hypothetical protein
MQPGYNYKNSAQKWRNTELIIDTQFMVASFPGGEEWRYCLLVYDVTCHRASSNASAGRSAGNWSHFLTPFAASSSFPLFR